MNYKRPLSRAEKRALQSTLEKFYTRHFNEHCKGTIPVLETLSTQLKGTLEELFQIMFAMLDVADIDERRTWSDKRVRHFRNASIGCWRKSATKRPAN